MPDIDYLILDTWFWAVNFHHYSVDEQWDNFRFPNFASLSPNKIYPSSVEWDLNLRMSNPINRSKFSDRDIFVLKQLTNTTSLSMSSLEKFIPTGKVSSTTRSLQRLVKKQVFRLYPQINFIGSQFPVLLGFDLNNYQLYRNLLNSLLLAPEICVITNDTKMQGLSYLKIPPESLSQLVNNIRNFHLLHAKDNNHIWFYDLARPYVFKRTLNLNNINFFLKDDVAYLH